MLADRAKAVTFACSLCGATAGSLRLTGRRGSAGVERSSFTSTLWLKVEPGQRRSLRAALRDADARALYDVDLELAPFYCPGCDAVYCGEHWQRWDVFADDHPAWHECIRGRCPQGHERMLED